MGDMALDVLQLPRPPTVVHPERFIATPDRDAIEARFDDREDGPACGLLETELDERRRLLRVVHLRIDRIRVPAIREVVLRIDSLDEHLHRDLLVSWMGNPAAD